RHVRLLEDLSVHGADANTEVLDRIRVILSVLVPLVVARESRAKARGVVRGRSDEVLDRNLTAEEDLARHELRTVTVRGQRRVGVLSLLVRNRDLERVLLSVVRSERDLETRDLVGLGARSTEVARLGQPRLTSEDVVLVRLLANGNGGEKLTTDESVVRPGQGDLGENGVDV